MVNKYFSLFGCIERYALMTVYVKYEYSGNLVE